MTSPTREQVLTIIEAGIRAPSADNRHHIRFEIADESLRIWWDGEYLDQAEPHRRILTLVSVGSVVENVRLRAAELGWSSECGPFLDPSNSGLIVEIAWKKPTLPPDELGEAIERRCTNRRFFRGPRLEARQLEALEAEVNKISRVCLTWLDGPLRRKALRLVFMAEAERFRRRLLHDELFSAIRFDVGWNQTCEEGLPPGALEVEPFLRGPFALLRHWNLMRAMNFVGASQALAIRAASLPCRFAPHLGAIATTDHNLEHGAIVVGRALERLWLRATLLGLSLQPLAASVILPLYPRSPDGASDAVRSSLRSGWQELTQGRSPLMLFRLGRAKPATLVASRRPVQSYLV